MMSNPIVNIEPEQPDVRIEISVANEGWTPVKGVDYFTKEDRAEIVDEVKQEIGEITSSDDSVKWVDDPYSAGATGKAVLGYPEPDSDALAYTTRNGKAMVLPNRVSINGQEYDADPYGTIRLPEEFYPTAASKDKRGGVKIGDGLELDGDTAYVPFATAAKPGIIRPGKGLIVTDYGQINVDGAVLYTDAQGLPEEMKSTARQNIGAASAQDVEQLTEEKADKKDIPAPYTLPTASDTVKGGVVVGKGLQMTGDVLSAVGGSEDKYELLETITIEEEKITLVRRDYPKGLVALKTIVRATAGGANANGVFGLRVMKEEGGYTSSEFIVPNMITTTSANIRSEDVIKGGLCDRTVCAPTGVMYGKPLYLEGVSIIMWQVYLQGGASFPIGTTIDIYGVRV